MSELEIIGISDKDFFASPEIVQKHIRQLRIALLGERKEVKRLSKLLREKK